MGRDRKPAEESVSRLPKTGYLSTPLSRDEQRFVGDMYRKHQGLLRMLGRKLCRKYPYVCRDDIYSCIDTGFIKTCRAWDPLKGTFSTLLSVFCEGDILHFVRDSNWTIRAPGAVRRNGQLARKMLERGHPSSEVMVALNINDEQLKLALMATQPIDHDVRGFDLHADSRPDPWEVLEQDGWFRAT